MYDEQLYPTRLELIEVVNSLFLITLAQLAPIPELDLVCPCLKRNVSKNSPITMALNYAIP